MKWIPLLSLLMILSGCLPAPQEPQALLPAPSTVESVPGTTVLVQPPRKVPGRPNYSVLVESRTTAAQEPSPEKMEDVLEHLHLADAASPRKGYEGLTLLKDELIFDFPMVDNEQVRSYIDYYTGEGREIFARLLHRAERYIPFMRRIFAERGLPQDLSYLALVESGFNPHAYSHAHAAGPWQFIPSTAEIYGLSNDEWRDERRDFEKSTRAAARFLSELYDRFDGDWHLAVAAYNAGGGRISRAMEENGAEDFWELCDNSSLRDETRNYVPKLLAVLTIVRDPAAYGFTDIPPAAPYVFDVVRLPEATDLELAARLCEVSLEELRALNPELKCWCTPPFVRDYALRIPAGHKSRFEKLYANIPSKQRAGFHRHRVTKGETLAKIARRYNLRPNDLIALNRLENFRTLPIGEELLLPLSPDMARLAEAKAASSRASTSTVSKTYKVRKGDTLWAISRRFGASAKDLRAWNGLTAKGTLRPGQTLKVAKVKAVAGKKMAAAKGERKIVYRVKSGDTLSAIGRKFAVATEQIQNWNRLAKNHILRPGDKLTLLVRDGNRS
ncbi:LysM peptidoglycan-binding domain-containing protein [Trichloromonas sp.]|uniref:lytic transglycosylase n=1 Tax=Trichloromonas sp. TaxID=3069249 RepID=UPI002A3A9D66|nr:LysM peptidoglycan-binding domain-containing protein [Trichloromonas sp.]